MPPGYLSDIGLPTIFVELLYSYVILFGPHKIFEGIAKKCGMQYVIIRSFRDKWSPMRPELMIEDFPIYDSRLQNIERTMDGWRPQTPCELAIQLYKDSFIFYTFWFSIFIGINGYDEFGGRQWRKPMRHSRIWGSNNFLLN